MANFKRVVNVIPLVRVNLGSTQIFTYLVPLAYQDQIRPGQLLKIPFGRRKILGVTSSPENHRLEKEIKGLKSIDELVDATPVLSEKNLALAYFLSEYYASPLGVVVKAMLPKLVKKPKPPLLSGYEKYNPDFLLTEHQRQAVGQISASLGRQSAFLLAGVTGSGKTEVYMQVMERLLEQGKQVIMLVPEISLTPQAVERFARRFGIEKIALLGSNLLDSERAFMWQKIRDKEKFIIIGPRSAVFAPVVDLGLIILDEEHDPSFKQYDQNPKYHARTAAFELSRLWGCPLVLGDATPSVEVYHQAAGGKISLLPLPYRIKADIGMPRVKIVDMRKEIAMQNFSVFSEALKFAIMQNLLSQKQIILFINRRGSATIVFCRDCGYVASCNQCAASLVWHSSTKKLICHHCGRNYQTPALCPRCGSSHIKHFGVGTQKIEDELIKFLSDIKPQPAIARVDRDNISKIYPAPAPWSGVYKDWASGKIRILIGTQMISKGWDLSEVGLVGIISADNILHLPDFRSNERTFQVLTQVAGRAGRGKETGTVILQTYYPDNYAIRAVKLHDYESFFAAEIEERRKYNYPPFARLIKLKITDKNAREAFDKAMLVKTQLLKIRQSRFEVIGPVPGFIPRVRGEYIFQIILKFPDSRAKYLEYLKDISNADIDVDPVSLL